MRALLIIVEEPLKPILTVDTVALKVSLLISEVEVVDRLRDKIGCS